MGEPVYEMLWDCRYCGEKKLLGLTHRHCVRCGAPQAPDARYFPADHEKVAVAEHRYVGADVVCRYCAAASSRLASHCGRCGAALAEGAPAPLQTPLQASPRPAPPSAPPRPSWRLLVPIALLAAVAVAVVLLVWKKEQAFVVWQHRWQRTINVERLGPVRESAWCAEMPQGARDVTRRRERRGSERVPDGEDCRAQKQDLGDGTFKEVTTCTPRFKEAPIYAEKCDFYVDKWHAERHAKAEGSAREPAPYWPSVAVAAPSEREGSRRETYTVLFQDSSGVTYRCEVPEKSWSSFVTGAAYRGQVRALGGSLDCASLVPR